MVDKFFIGKILIVNLFILVKKIKYGIWWLIFKCVVKCMDLLILGIVVLFFILKDNLWVFLGVFMGNIKLGVRLC